MTTPSGSRASSAEVTWRRGRRWHHSSAAWRSAWASPPRPRSAPAVPHSSSRCVHSTWVRATRSSFRPTPATRSITRSRAAGLRRCSAMPTPRRSGCRPRTRHAGARLDAFIARRRALAARYRAALARAPRCRVPADAGERHVYYRFVVAIESPLTPILAHLERRGVTARRPVFRPIHQALGLSGYPNAERLWAECLSLPWGGLDTPAARKVHDVATPLLGGAAVYCAFAVTVLSNFDFSLQLKGVAVGATLVVAIGILDDITDLRASLKLLGHVGAAVAAIAYGVVLNIAPYWVPGFAWLNVGLTILWFVTVTNAIQFLDGMDGLATGLGVIAGIFFSIAALQAEQRYLMYLSAALVGACLGFLPYNFRSGRAQIFLGDSGATFIGFTLAGLAVMGEWAEGDPLIALLTPLLILGVPLFDIGFVGVARIVTGKVHSLPEWLAYTGRDHIHHRFEQLGLTKKQSVLLIFFLAATLGLSAILLKDATPHEAVLVLIQAACVLAIVAVLEGVGRWRPRP